MAAQQVAVKKAQALEAAAEAQVRICLLFVMRWELCTCRFYCVSGQSAGLLNCVAACSLQQRQMADA